MSAARQYHVAWRLLSGSVIVAGGSSTGGTVLRSAEIYNPVTKNWTPTLPMNAKRQFHAVSVLQNGSGLVTGGFNGNIYLNSAEIYIG